MTREEINKKISELRGEIPQECGYEWSAFSPITGTNSAHYMHRCVEPWTHTRTSGVMDWESDHHCMCGVNLESHSYEHVTIKDWQSDANWPTLLRELPSVGLKFDPSGGGWWHCSSPYYFQSGPYLHEESHDLGEAVCLAWLKWKERLSKRQ